MAQENCGNCCNKMVKRDGKMQTCPVFKAATDSFWFSWHPDLFFCGFYKSEERPEKPQLPEKFSIYDRNGDMVRKLNQLNDFLKARDGK